MISQLKQPVPVEEMRNSKAVLFRLSSENKNRKMASELKFEELSNTFSRMTFPIQDYGRAIQAAENHTGFLGCIGKNLCEITHVGGEEGKIGVTYNMTLAAVNPRRQNFSQKWSLVEQGSSVFVWSCLDLIGVTGKPIKKRVTLSIGKETDDKGKPLVVIDWEITNGVPEQPKLPSFGPPCCVKLCGLPDFKKMFKEQAQAENEAVMMILQDYFNTFSTPTGLPVALKASH